MRRARSRMGTTPADSPLRAPPSFGIIAGGGGQPTGDLEMGKDIIAENQTEQMIQLLLNGDADAKAQQVALAAVLRATMDQAKELEEIKRNLWKPDDLEKAVSAQLRMKCQDCPARKRAEERGGEKQNWLLALVTSESFRYFILILMFAWALIVVTSGRENAKAVGEHVKSTLSGGAAK